MVNLSEIYRGLQKEMLDNLERSDLSSHPTSKGDDTEAKWLNWLDIYLPKKYSVNQAFLIDCEGNISDQIDCVIYDNFHSPPIIEQEGFRYIPAESVYAVFEIKQDITKKHIEYARNKAASVRALKRTSAPFVHATGVSNTTPNHIIAGILTKRCGMTEKTLNKHLNIDEPHKRLDIGCSLDTGFRFDDDRLIFSNKQYTLVSFFYGLLSQIRKTGTTAAIDYSEYMKCMDDL